MKTKRILVVAILATVLSSMQVMAQNKKQDNVNREAKMNELLDKRCQRIESQLSLDDKTAAKFTPLYKEYMQSIRNCHPTNRDNRKGELSDSERIKRMDDGFKTRQMMLDTQKKYYNEFKKILNARQLEMLFSSHRKQQNLRQCDSKRNAQFDKRNARKRHAAYRANKAESQKE